MVHIYGMFPASHITGTNFSSSWISVDDKEWVPFSWRWDVTTTSKISTKVAGVEDFRKKNHQDMLNKHPHNTALILTQLPKAPGPDRGNLVLLALSFLPAKILGWPLLPPLYISLSLLLNPPPGKLPSYLAFSGGQGFFFLLYSGENIESPDHLQKQSK